MTEDHKHCRNCQKPIPMDKRPRFCSGHCEDIHFLALVALAALLFGLSGYLGFLLLAGTTGG